MSLTPTQSIIIPAYNVERYIEQCLLSVLTQLEPHHALIVINDGSTDNTPALIERLQREHGGTNFKVINQANQGIAATRNNGLAAAAGEYIVFVDGDDLLLPGSLAALDRVILAHRPDVIACDFNLWHPDRESKNRRITLGYPADVLIRDREAILHTFFADRHMYLWANVIRRAIYQRLPMPVFPPNRKFEDVAVLASLLAGCEHLFHLPHAIVDYRQHPSSITKAISEQSCLDFAAALRQVKTCFEQQPVSDAIKLSIDVTATYFYTGNIKDTYQLPWGRGRSVRAKVKAIYLDSLLNAPDHVFAAMSNRAAGSRDSRRDADTARQARQSLNGSLMFDVSKAVSRRIKLWQRMRQQRRVR
jgi:glycosyltransferase involved in cell wall biosynthesis